MSLHDLWLVLTKLADEAWHMPIPWGVVGYLGLLIVIWFGLSWVLARIFVHGPARLNIDNLPQRYRGWAAVGLMILPGVILLVLMAAVS